MKKYYAGIGSRKTPDHICQLMTVIASKMEELNYIGRSGHADGADISFENGCKNPENFQAFLPWPKFNGATTPMFDIPFKAYELAAKYHPGWQFLKLPIRHLMARNCQQILGPNLDEYSEVVICWTPDGASTKQETSQETGGTGQAIRVADDHNIPIYNLQRDDHKLFIMEMIESKSPDFSRENFKNWSKKTFKSFNYKNHSISVLKKELEILKKYRTESHIHFNEAMEKSGDSDQLMSYVYDEQYLDREIDLIEADLLFLERKID